MGLIGGLIGPVANQCDHLLMQPEQFIRRPLRFLRALSEQDVTLSGCPPFGLDYIVRKVSAADLGECGFSHVKAVFVGAERIDRGTVDGFMKLMGPRGLRPEAILPAYGGAEATLVVTMSPLTRAWSSVRVEPFSLVLGQRVALAEDGQDIVSCGPPVPGTSVTIIDEQGSLVPEGTVGEIIVSGPSVAAGYAGPVDEESAQVFAQDRLRTRDAGFTLNGELYVLGRLGDSLKVRGRTLFAEDVEVTLRDAGVPSVRSAALLGIHQGTSTVVILLEHLQPGWPGEIMRQLTPLAESVQVVLAQVGGGAILRTSSGKVRRRALWQQYMQGELPHTVVAP
jgi:acyl-CoA synthetase (AMP-forming)/AMP-acid ligase II